MKPRGLQPHAWLLTRVLRQFLRKLVSWKLFHVRVIGKDHIPPHGAAIIACNHLSFADPVVAWGAVPRNLVAVAMKELWRTPLVFLLWLLGHIPVDRKSRDSGARVRRAMKRVIDWGGLVLIFPEGKCSRDGTLQAFKSGAADVAFETGTPLIPAAVVGTERLWPLGTHAIDRRQEVVIVFGAPLYPEEFASAEDLNYALRATVVVLQAVAS